MGGVGARWLVRRRCSGRACRLGWRDDSVGRSCVIANFGVRNQCAAQDGLRGVILTVAALASMPTHPSLCCTVVFDTDALSCALVHGAFVPAVRPVVVRSSFCGLGARPGVRSEIERVSHGEERTERVRPEREERS